MKHRFIGLLLLIALMTLGCQRKRLYDRAEDEAYARKRIQQVLMDTTYPPEYSIKSLSLDLLSHDKINNKIVAKYKCLIVQLKLPTTLEYAPLQFSFQN